MKIFVGCIGVMKAKGFLVPKLVGKITEPAGLGPKAQLTRSAGPGCKLYSRIPLE